MSNNALVGNAGVISVDGVNVAEVRNYSIEITADTIETTTMGGANAGRTYVKGLTTFSGTADVYWDDQHFDAATGVDLDGLVQGAVGAGSVALIIYPEGVSAGDNWNGAIIITGYSITASMDGLIEASISFQGDGQLTYTAS
jgi:predicted secreted protein